MPTGRLDLAAATVTNAAGQSIVYAIGGRRSTGAAALATVTAYNVATNTWTSRRSLPRPLYRTNGAGVIDGKIYVSGGCYSSDCIYSPPTSRLYVYDPTTNTWTQKRSVPSISDGGVTGVMRGKLYVLTPCFYDQGGPYYSSCDPWHFYRYNPVTDRWATLPSPPTGIGLFGMGGVIDGKFYAMGQSPTDAVDGMLAVYDPATNRWAMKTPLARTRFGSAVVALNHKMYVMGGIRLQPDGPWETLDITIVLRPDHRRVDAPRVPADRPLRHRGKHGLGQRQGPD